MERGYRFKVPDHKHNFFRRDYANMRTLGEANKRTSFSLWDETQKKTAYRIGKIAIRDWPTGEDFVGPASEV